jgi:serine/threonine-protein kinase
MSDSRQYRILSVLGHGGFGSVYRAEYSGPGGFSKAVALKVLRPEVEDNEEVAQRFRDEARLLGLIRHRAIVKVDGLVRLSGRQVVVMELVEGVSLRELGAVGTMPPGPALEVVAEVANALDSAWNQLCPQGKPLHLLHRDIKPSNIQLTRAGEVKLLDFGIARADFAHREAETQMLAFGSVPYMSPERKAFEDSPAGDIYALGAVLYEVLAGRRLGPSGSSAERQHALLAKRLTPLRELHPEQGDALVRLLAQCLAYEAGHRPSARELAREASSMASRIGGESLREWSDERVPLAVSRRAPLSAEDFSGSSLLNAVLAEPTPQRPPAAPWPTAPTRIRASGPDVAPPALAPPPGMSPWAMLGAFALMGLLLIGLLVMLVLVVLLIARS